MPDLHLFMLEVCVEFLTQYQPELLSDKVVQLTTG